MRNAALVAAVTIIALGSSGTAAAAPPGRIPNGTSIGLAVTSDHESAAIDIDGGSMTVQDGRFQIRDDNGTVIAGTPLHVNIDNIVYPVTVRIESHHATLTPSTTGAYFERADAATPITRSPQQEQESQAWGRMGGRIGTGVAVGALVGSIFAATTGCVLGAATGTLLTLPLAALLGGGTLAGCVVGATLMLPVGTLFGSLAIGVPVAIAAAIEYVTTAYAPLPSQDK
ncbi:hypothetical protein [Nocardia colli]|uniref:hypothetical protein n=1 Tax=Nocardia colli TaxID=2545717 RepID=UPI0035D83302